MDMNRRSFLSTMSGVAAVTFIEPGSPLAPRLLDPAAYAQSAAAGAATSIAAIAIPNPLLIAFNIVFSI